jgi:hypothetical protein
MHKKGMAAAVVLILIGLVLAVSGCIDQETPTTTSVTKKQLNETEYNALVYSVADTMDNAEDTLIDTHDGYLNGYLSASEASALFKQTSATMQAQEDRMNAVIPPAGYETLNGYIISAIQKEKKCADLCVTWVETGNAQSEEDAEALLKSAQVDLNKAIAEMKKLGY